MGTIVKLTDKQPVAESSTNGRTWRERPLSERWLFHGEDEAGRLGWFVRIEVTGLYPRRVGPFATKAEAVKMIEYVAGETILELFTNLQNNLTIDQACLVEGVPTLRC